MEDDAVPEVRVLRVEPDDSIVLTFPAAVTKEKALDFAERVQTRFPANEILIFGGGVQIGVVRHGERAAA